MLLLFKDYRIVLIKFYYEMHNINFYIAILETSHLVHHFIVSILNTLKLMKVFWAITLQCPNSISSVLCVSNGLKLNKCHL